MGDEAKGPEHLVAIPSVREAFLVFVKHHVYAPPPDKIVSYVDELYIFIINSAIGIII